MLFRSIFTAAIVATAAADFVIETDTYSFTTSFSDKDKASKWAESKSKQLEKALSTYQTHLTAQPAYSSALSELYAYVATRTDAPGAVITATTTTTSYTKEPAWYTAAPKDLKDYLQSVADDRVKIFSSVVSHDAAHAARPTGMVAYMGAGLAAAAAGAAVLL